MSSPSQDWVAVGAFSPQALFVNTLGDAFPTGNQASVYVLDSAGQILYQSGSVNQNGNPCDHPDVVTICKNTGGITYVKAGATHARLSIHFQPQEVILEVSDDGKGFEVPKSPSEFSPSGHFGLLGMHERAELIGAELKINTSPGHGTRVKVIYHG